MKSLNSQGVAKLFPPGTNTAEIVSYIKDWVIENRIFYNKIFANVILICVLFQV